MWFNSKQREEPYQPLTSRSRAPEMELFSSAGPETGAAWLSSARVVRCWVKSRNERNPCELLLPSTILFPVEMEIKWCWGTLFRLPCETGRKVGTTSSQDGPYAQGCTRTTMLSTERSEIARWRKSLKLSPVRIVGCNSPT